MLWNSISKYVAIGLGVLCLITSGGWWLTDLSLTSVRKDLQAEKVGRQTDRDSYTKAQQLAAKAAEDLKIKTERDYSDKAKASDQSYATLLSKYNASLLRYRTAQGVPSGTSSGPQVSVPESGDGPSPDPQLSISVADAQICATNTARLKSVHDWAEGFK